jgi:hypothetical protein
MTDGGKGSKPRPFSISQEEYASRWDAIFQRDGLDDKDKKQVDEHKQASYNSDSTEQKD